MDRMGYASAVGTMRVYEKRLLDQARIDRLVDSRDADDAFKILQETEYQRSMSGIKSPRDFESVLKTELEKVYKDLYKMTKDRELIEILALKYDYQNIKVLLKHWALGQETPREMLSDMGTLPADELKADFDAQDFKSLGDNFSATFTETITDYEKNKDPQRIDMVADKHYYSHMNELKNELKDIPIVQDYISYQTDRNNILSLLRAKKQERDLKFVEDLIHEGGEIPRDLLISLLNESYDNIAAKLKRFKSGQRIVRGIQSFGETGSLSVLERELDNGMMEIIKPSKAVNFGPEPLFAYVAAKERENKLLRIIMVSKINNISPEKIRERLRDLYV